MTDTWASRPVLAIDIESTGIDPFTDRIVEIAAVFIRPDGTPYDGYRTIVNPGVVIPEIPAGIHGITTDRAVAEGVTPTEAITTVARMIWEHIAAWDGQAAITMFNARFDWPMLLIEGDRHYADIPVAAPIADPYILDRLVDPRRRGSRKLIDVAALYGVQLKLEDAHGALADAVAAGQLVHAILTKHPDIADLSLGGLLIEQIRTHETWRDGFVDWKRRNNDPSFDIPAGWPIPVGPERGTTADLVPISSSPAPVSTATTDAQDGNGAPDTVPVTVQPSLALSGVGEGAPEQPAAVPTERPDPYDQGPQTSEAGVPLLTKAQRGKLFAVAGELWPATEQRERVLDVVEALTGRRLESRADIDCVLGARVIDLLERIQTGQSELRRDKSNLIREWVLDHGWAEREGQAA